MGQRCKGTFIASLAVVISLPGFAAAATTGYTLQATLTGSTVTVAWTAPAGHSTSDWVAIYPVGADNYPWPSDFVHLPLGQTSGTLSFSTSAPVARPPGTYEARLFRDGSVYAKAATSNVITVGAGGTPPATASYTVTATLSGSSIIVAWTAPDPPTAQPLDWIGLFAEGVSQYLAYQRPAPGQRQGQVVFQAPTQSGRYEFRYGINNRYQFVATSPPVTVGPSHASDTTPPQIRSLSPTQSPTLFGDRPVIVSADVVDDDPFTTTAEYQFSIDGRVEQPWGKAPTYWWDTKQSGHGRHTVQVDVRDAGGAQSMAQDLYLYREPPNLPSQ